LVAALLLERTAVTGELCAFFDRALVAEAKKLWPRRSAYRGLSRTNVRRRLTLLAYHHPAQLCWDWLIDVEFLPALSWRAFKPRSWLGWYKTPQGRLQSAWVQLPGVIRFSLHRQDYGWMLSHAGEQRLLHKVNEQVSA
jgi:hypothetical protein